MFICSKILFVYGIEILGEILLAEKRSIQHALSWTWCIIWEFFNQSCNVCYVANSVSYPTAKYIYLVSIVKCLVIEIVLYLKFFKAMDLVSFCSMRLAVMVLLPRKNHLEFFGITLSYCHLLCRFLFDTGCLDYKYYEYRLLEEEKVLAQVKESQASNPSEYNP